MKKLILLSTLILLGFALPAQTQQGYVKTKGRMVNGKLVPGQGLKGATVSIQGRTSVSVQNHNGSFSFPIPSKSFIIKSVTKNGYKLVDADIIGQPFHYSNNPIYLVMETPEKQLQDQLDTERKIRHTLQQQLQQRENQIEALKEQQVITINEYNEAREKLYKEIDKNNLLVKDMAKRYALIDYDQLDEFYQQVAYLIDNGELSKADSLLKTRGNINKQITNILQRGKDLKKKKEQIENEETIQEADIIEASFRCTRYYETFARKYLNSFDRQYNDSAAYYLELRASLDTTNIDWQFEVGQFIVNGFFNNDSLTIKSVLYLNQALKYAKLEYGLHPITARCYYELGRACQRIKDFNNAIEYFNMALSINNSLFGEKSIPSLLCLNHLGNSYRSIHEYDLSITSFEKAYNIAEEQRKKCKNNENPSVYDSFYSAFDNEFNKRFILDIDYSNICDGYFSLDMLRSIANNYHYYENYTLAVEYYKKTLVLTEALYGPVSDKIVERLHDIADNYRIARDYTNALHYYRMELHMIKELYIQKCDGHNSNDKWTSCLKKYNALDEHYCNMDIGRCYKRLGDYEKAIEIFTDQILYRQEYFKDHKVLQEIGESYLMKGEPDSAITNFDKGFTFSKDLLSIPAYDNKTLKSIPIYDEDVLSLLSDSSSTIYQEFFSGLVFLCSFYNGDTPARQQGLNGNYVLLEYADWNQNKKISLFDKNKEFKGKPKDILTLKNGQITQHHFDNTLGALLRVRYVGKKEKQRINALYEEWKKQNRP